MEEIDLSVFFHTKAQANDFSIRLSSLSEKLYETDFNLEKLLIDNLGIEKKDKFISLLRNSNVNTGSVSDLKAFFDKLQENITKLPILSITLAFEPTEETLKLLDEWFMLNIKRHYVFDISVSPEIIAGTTINFNGKYLDCSIKTKFDKIIQDALVTEAKNPPLVKHQAPSV
jgi:hypothetical protein